jgi:hypothetical protein
MMSRVELVELKYPLLIEFSFGIDNIFIVMHNAKNMCFFYRQNSKFYVTKEIRFIKKKVLLCIMLST